MSNMNLRFQVMRSPLVWGLSALMLIGPHSLWGATWKGDGKVQGPSNAPSAETRQIAARKLERAGLAPEEAKARLSTMREQEIAHIANSQVEVRRGGDAVVSILVIVLLVGLIFYVFHHAECRT